MSMREKAFEVWQQGLWDAIEEHFPDPEETEKVYNYALSGFEAGWDAAKKEGEAMSDPDIILGMLLRMYELHLLGVPTREIHTNGIGMSEQLLAEELTEET